MKFLDVIFKNRFRLKLRILLVLLAVILVIIFLFAGSFVSYKLASDIIFSNIKRIDESNLKQVNNRFCYSLGEIERVLKKIRKDNSLIQYLNDYKQNESNTYEKLKIKHNISVLFSQTLIVYDNINSIRIYTEEGFFPSSSCESNATYSELKMSGLYDAIKSSENNIAIFKPEYDSFLKENFPGIVFATVLINKKREYGLLFLEMKPEWINSLLKPDENIIIYDSITNSAVWNENNEKYIFNNISPKISGDSGSFTGKIRNQKLKFLYKKTIYGSWYIITYKNADDVFKQIREVTKYIIVSFIFSLLSSFIAALLLSGRIIEPLRDLINLAGKYKGKAKARFVSTSKMRLSLRDNIMLYFILILTFPMVINSLTLYFSLSGVIRNKITESVLLTFNQTKSTIDYFLESNDRISINIMFDKNVQDYFIKSYSSQQQESLYSNSPDLDNIIDESLSLGENIFEASLYDIRGKLVFSTTFHNQENLEQEYIQKISNTYENAFWAFCGKDKYNRNTIKLFRRISGKGDEPDNTYLLNSIGYVVMTYYEINFEELYRDINIENYNVFVVDDSGIIISHKTKSLIGQSYDMPLNNNDLNIKGITANIDGKRYFTIYAYCNRAPWVLVGEIPYTEIFKDNNKIIVTNIYTFAICVFIIAALSFIISNRITESIGRLNNNLLKFGYGDIKVDFTEEIYINEIEELGETFNKMSQRIQELIESVYVSQIKEKELENQKKDAENEKRQAELIALQAQINPHFLYNTFESVIWLIDEGDRENAAEMLAVLGELFRMGIGNVDQFISIGEEIEYARTYVDIHKLRLGSKFEVKWFIDEKAVSYRTPKLILQPLLENAIHHGIQEKLGNGAIEIYCYEDSGNIHFKIIDNGVGIEPEKLLEIEKVLKGKLKGNSIGIFNVQKRINLYFGKEYGISIESSPGLGTAVTVTMPSIEK